MAQSLHIGLYGFYTNLHFRLCAIYFDRKVTFISMVQLWFGGGELVFDAKCVSKAYILEPHEAVAEVSRIEKV